MIPKECKRLAEVDFPIAVVSAHAAREKSIRHGHPSTLHLWWARRPLASSRAMLMALLLPDPCDPLCPVKFKNQAREIVAEVRKRPESDEELRKALFWFIGSFANWDLASEPTYLRVARNLVKAAHPKQTTLVVDPFAGGGSIPLEALRLNCEAFASDLNPVACLILKVLLEDIPRHGHKLAQEVLRMGVEIRRQAKEELAELYPLDPDGAAPIAYLWARTVFCEAPRCGAEIPLLRSAWLCKKPKRKRALNLNIVRAEAGPPRLEFEIVTPMPGEGLPDGTITGAKATCPCCSSVLPPERVRRQLANQRGGADVVFDSEGRRTGGAILMAVVTLRPGEQGRYYRVANESDYVAVRCAHERLTQLLKTWERGERMNPAPVPEEPLPAAGTLGFRVQRYGMRQWGDLFTARQKVVILGLANAIRKHRASPLVETLALALDGVVDRNAVLSRWRPQADQEKVENVFARQALPMSWDFAEAVALSESTGSWDDRISSTARTIESLSSWAHRTGGGGQVQQADANEHPLPDQTAGVWFTDPPYYDAVPYADLSDFFLVWLKRSLPGQPLLKDPFDPENLLSPKMRETVQDKTKRDNGNSKDRGWFEVRMAKAFAEGRRVLREDGVGSVVFAHKTTEGWEALLSGLIRGGWTITGSWPIATEMATRLRARESAALATSIHLVCRPRPEVAPIGDWGDVRRELPQRVAAWMERLQSEGVRGADLVFACIGPALEIYSRYSKVVDAEEREIPLGGDPEAIEPRKRGFLAYVWEVVGRAALSQVLSIAGGTVNGTAVAALEDDARLSALFLWTFETTKIIDNGEGKKTEEEEEPAFKKKGAQMSLPFDVVRRIAQPLGIHLPDWEGRIIIIEKGVVRLLSLAERAQQLFGKEGAQAVADELEAAPSGAKQMALFAEAAGAPPLKTRGRKKSRIHVTDDDLTARQESTTLDRVHAAMLLQASGRANALRALLKAEQQRGPEFLRLANALSALYPKGTEERRLVEAMLQAVPR